MASVSLGVGYNSQILRYGERRRINGVVLLLVIVFIRTTNSPQLPPDISLTPETCPRFQ